MRKVDRNSMFINVPPYVMFESGQPCMINGKGAGKERIQQDGRVFILGEKAHVTKVFIGRNSKLPFLHIRMDKDGSEDVVPQHWVQHVI